MEQIRKRATTTNKSKSIQHNTQAEQFQTCRQGNPEEGPEGQNNPPAGCEGLQEDRAVPAPGEGGAAGQGQEQREQEAPV